MKLHRGQQQRRQHSKNSDCILERENRAYLSAGGVDV